jgi:hypothetical protein
MRIGQENLVNNKLTATEVMAKLNSRSLRKSTVTGYMNRMTRREKRELRRIANEQFGFYRQLRQLVGIYRTSGSGIQSVRTRNQKRRLASLPYSIDVSGNTPWKLVDATRGVLLKGNRLLIPTVQQSFSGTLYLDVRVWYYEEDDETMTVRPTRKGVTVPLDRLTELRQRLTALDVRNKKDEND